MPKRHEDKLIERARDELFSHVIRCDVLEAHQKDREEWLVETMEFMAYRYPQLEPLQLAQLTTWGERFIKPVIPHGADQNAMNRDEWQEAA